VVIFTSFLLTSTHVAHGIPSTNIEHSRGHFLANDESLLMLARQDVNRTYQRPVTAACRKSFTTHPDDAYCPDNCPFLRREPTGFCDFKCVKASECNDDDPMASFADKETMRCTSCNVPACHRCGNSHKSCAVCHEGYVLKRQSTLSLFRPYTWFGSDPDAEENYICKGQYRFLWHIFFAFAGSVLLLLVAYIINLATRSESNHLALQHAMRCRASATLREKKLMIDLCHNYVSGVGVMLHFRFQMYAICAAVVCFLVLFVTAQTFDDMPVAMKSPRSFGACDVEISEQKVAMNQMEQKYLTATVILYLLGTFLSFFVAGRQQRYAHFIAEKTTTMQDYAIYLRGLPKVPGNVKAEEIIAKHLQEAVGDKGKIIGVSVCWDFRHCSSTVEDQVEWELKKLDEKRDAEADDAHAKAREAANSTLHSARQSHSNFFYKLDYLIFGIKEHHTPEQKAAKFELERREALAREETVVKEMLSRVYSTDAAYVVLTSERERDDCLKFLQDNQNAVDMKALYDEMQAGEPQELVVKHQDCEPGVIMWQNHGVSKRSVALKLLASAFALVVAIAILDLIFYFPSVHWLLSHMSVQGHREGGLSLTVLGLLVVVCNQAIYAIIDQLADMIGFKNNDTRQRFYVVWYTAAVFINTILDLGVVVLTAQGFSMDQLQSMDIDADAAMSVRAIADNPAIQNALFYQFIMYTWPSCLLVPFLIEPLLQVALYFVMSWLVRSRHEIDADMAESFLMWAPFDLAHYGDVLVNFMLCATTLFFNQTNLWFIWAALVISLLYICAWDHCRFLRFSRRSIFVSSNLDYTVQKLMAIPCAIIAACIAYRIVEQDVKGGILFGLSTDALHDGAIHLFTIAGIGKEMLPQVPMALAAVLHVVFHWIVLDAIIPWYAKIEVDHDKDKSYEQTATELPRNWFNANPLHTLRSKYVYEHENPVVMFRSGKEYLLSKNPELGQFYTCDPPTVDENMHEMFQHALRDAECGLEEAKEIAKNARHSVSAHIAALERVITHSSDGPPSASPSPSAETKPSSGGVHDQ